MTKPLPTRRIEDQPDANESRTLIDELLAEQGKLTAVDKFCRAHDANELRSRLYRDLLPATPPAPGQQYAFEVNLDQCSGCKACVSACHSLNGLDDDETWRGVGLLMDTPNAHDAKRRVKQGIQQNISTACHHCVDPACLNGCPVLAYDKDPLTGIVRHLDDQCIGCQYCVMMCPYEVPQYSKARGIVRKCDMCHSRLAVGEAPACVQACPTSAISITVVEQAKVRGKYRDLLNTSAAYAPGGKLGKWETGKAATSCVLPHFLTFPLSQIPSKHEKADRNTFLSASPNPAITLPTTRFVTQRTFPEDLFAGDASVVRRSNSHLPLVFLLTLSQFAIGASVAASFVKPALPLLLIALVVGLVALLAGSLHLGQPRKAWRSFLGWRKSWFSREVIAMSAFLILVTLVAGVTWLPAVQPLENILTPSAAAAGLLTVTCSAMIYVDTRREFWNPARSFTNFFGTTLLLGTAATFATLAFAAANHAALVAAAGTLMAATVVKLAFERRIFEQLVDEDTFALTPINKTARLLAGELNGFVRARIAFGVLGGLLLPLLAVVQLTTNASTIPGFAVVALALCVVGEFIERYLFFTAVVTQKMPGALSS